MKRLSIPAIGVLLVMFTLGGMAYAGHGQVNINTATTDDLQWLPGINEMLAQNIIEFRQVNGAFTSIDDLVKVEGMDEAKLREIRNFIKLEGMSDYSPAELTPKEGHAPEGKTK